MQMRPLVSGRGLLLVLVCSCLAAWSSLVPAARALQLCTDGRAPVPLNRTLGFCSSYGSGSSSCCDDASDAALRRQFEAMKVADAACAAAVKSVLCAKCSPFSAELFNSSSELRMVPLLCNSTSSASSVQSKDSTQDYCKLVWESCKSVPIINSPFQPPLQGKARLPSSSSSKLTDVWQSEEDFCTTFGGSSDKHSLCFIGNTVSFNAEEPSPTPKGICLEKVGNGSYLNLAPHPDGSNRAFVSSQAGKIWLATIPEQGSGGTLQIDEANPFLDLTDEVHFDSEFGLMGLAFHPKFATNGRFFVSYNCDRTQSPSCAGRCSCNSDADCDPSKLGTDNGAQPCKYQVVVSEYSAKVSSNISADAYEEVDLITKGGNYGWRVYEGPYIFHPQQSPGGNTSVDSINAIFPIMGYNHSSVNKKIGSASITGGYVYRGSTDPCLYGRYLYTDLYSSAMWTGTETPENSGNYTSSSVPLSCSKTSPIACDSTAGSHDPLLGYIFSFGEDNSKDIFILSSKGVYRVVRPSLCNYTCFAEKPETNNGTTTPGPSSFAPATRFRKSMVAALALFVCALYN
ncbi:hypothetical protein PR202_gb11352 [Eleusine coracana subsp. coracana]|uniref:HIPL1 protein n=1 Tax=Eleusine coracana subsp. coracana TaxID=191504 RepID=A0AAV5EK01_ELECO|nr:hypothetical protein PR202_gb11352 [Eleusine coracana subsp. coracana]